MQAVQVPEDRYISTHADTQHDDATATVNVDAINLLRFVRRTSHVCETLLGEIAADAAAKRSCGKSELSVSSQIVNVSFLANRTILGCVAVVYSSTDVCNRRIILFGNASSICFCACT